MTFVPPPTYALAVISRRAKKIPWHIGAVIFHIIVVIVLLCIYLFIFPMLLFIISNNVFFWLDC